MITDKIVTPEQMEQAAKFFMENFQNGLDADPKYRGSSNVQLVRALCRNYVIDQGKWDNTL